MKIKFFLALVFFSVKLYSQEIESENWKTDLNFLKTELAKKHKNLFYKISRKNFERGISNIINKLDEDSDIETALKLSQLIAKIEDSHTTINISNILKKRKSIPLDLFWFKEGLFVVGSMKDNYEILDKKIIAINGYKTETIIDSLKTLFVDENNALVKINTPNLFESNTVLKYFGFSKQNDSIYNYEVADLNGNISKIDIKEIEMTMKNNRDKISSKVIGDKPFYINGSRSNFKEKYFPNEKIYFIQYNKCISSETVEKYGDKEKSSKYPSFDEFEKLVIKNIENSDIDKLIFDMRFNEGGSSYLAESLIDKIADNKSINKKGKLFVVVGSKTFSSAIFNSVYFKEKTEAIVIGEETSGKPNHFGYVKSFTLPYSNIKVTYSSEFWKLMQKDTNTITPDIIIENSFNDFKNGIDPIFEYVKNVTNE